MPISGDILQGLAEISRVLMESDRSREISVRTCEISPETRADASGAVSASGPAEQGGTSHLASSGEKGTHHLWSHTLISEKLGYKRF